MAIPSEFPDVDFLLNNAASNSNNMLDSALLTVTHIETVVATAQFMAASDPTNDHLQTLLRKSVAETLAARREFCKLYLEETARLETLMPHASKRIHVVHQAYFQHFNKQPEAG